MNNENESKITNNKRYIIKKDRDENRILNIKEYFEKEDKFLTINPKISIGNLSNHFTKKNKKEEMKIFLPLNSFKNSKKSRNTKESKLFLKENNSNVKSPKKDFYLSSYDNKNIKTDKNMEKSMNIKKSLNKSIKGKSKDIHYKFKSFEDLKNIFSAGKKREKDFKLKGTNGLIPLKTEINIKREYISQGKQLKYNSIYKSFSEKYIKNIAKKCKRNETEMLVNNIQNFRMKKQIKDYVENNKILAEKFGDYYWLFSLRRARKNEFMRYDYYNVGTSEREIWKRFVDYPDKVVELTNLPYGKGKKNYALYTDIYKDSNKEKIPKINEFEDIKIEGKNLAKKEYNDIIDSYNAYHKNINFKLYKDPIEEDKNHVKDLIYKEIYQLRNNKKLKLKIQLLKK